MIKRRKKKSWMTFFSRVDALRDNSGIALVLALFVIVTLITLSCVFVLRTINERNVTLRDVDSSKAFYIAEAGSNFALAQLEIFINEYLPDTLNATSNSLIEATFSDLSSGIADSLDFLVDYVYFEEDAIFSSSGSAAVHSIPETSLGDGVYAVEIAVKEKAEAVEVATNKWDFFYYYTITSTGTVDDVSRVVILSGDFTVRAQKDNFAKFALFTNQQNSQTGSIVWFTGSASFNGPVHTNDRLNFAMNPGGFFRDKVTQVETSARFYNNGFSVLLDADNNGTSDVPRFSDEFERGVDPIALSSLTQKQELIDEVDAGNIYSSDGVYLPNDGSNLEGGIYIVGNSSIVLSVNGSDQAVYEITQGTTTYEITVNRTLSQTTVDDGTTSTTYSGLPDGVDNVGTIIYSENDITSLSGTVQSDTNLTISSDYDIYIQGNLVYADYSSESGTPRAVGTDNMLGIVSWTGDVLIGTLAPNDVTIHATVLAKEGVFTVDAYDDTVVGPRGTVTLLGGVISDNYGVFGTFSGVSGANISGYGRNFVYDARMLKGDNPPYFPSLDFYTGFSSDVADKIVWQEGEV